MHMFVVYWTAAGIKKAPTILTMINNDMIREKTAFEIQKLAV